MCTTLTIYAFGSEEHLYSDSGSNQGNTYYYSLGGRLISELTGSPSPLSTNIFLTDALGSILPTFSNTANSAALLGTQVYNTTAPRVTLRGQWARTKTVFAKNTCQFYRSPVKAE